MPVEVFKEILSYDHISPAQLEERIKMVLIRMITQKYEKLLNTIWESV